MNALRSFRKSRGIRLHQMAEKLSVSVATLSRIENGKQWPDRAFFERVATATSGEVTANDFVQAPAPAPTPDVAEQAS